MLDALRSNPQLIAADDYEWAVQRVESATRTFSGGQLCDEKLESQWWVGLRILHRKKVGRSHIFGTSPPGLQWLVQSAFALADRSTPDPWFRFPIWKKGSSGAASDIPLEPLVLPTSTASELGAAGTAVTEVYTSRQESSWIFRKIERGWKQEGRKIFLRTLRVSTDTASVFSESQGQGVPFDGNLDRIQRVLAVANDLMGTAAPPVFLEGALQVVFGPRVLAALLCALEDVWCAPVAGRGYAIESGVSPVLDVVDDGTIPLGMYSASFDLEGSPMQRTVLIQKGEWRTFLHDARSAAVENRASTGNFHRRPEECWPTIRPTQLFVSPGNIALKEMIPLCRGGYYFPWAGSIERIDSGEPGDVRLRVRGWKVSSTGGWQALGEVTLETNLGLLLRRAAVVGSDLEVFCGFGSPSILFEEIPKRR